MAMLDQETPEWREALRLVRMVADSPSDGREPALAAARAFLAAAESPRLRSYARLLAPGASERSVIAALVPLERVDARTRITDADLGLTDTDRRVPAAKRASPTSEGAARPPALFPLVAVADNIRSAFNVGGLFRTADFFGVESLILCGYTATPENPQVVRAALGAEAAVPWRHVENIRDAVKTLKAEGRKIYALETAEGARDVDSFPFEFPAALLLGSERFGLDPDVVAKTDGVVAIPAHGIKNSLNVVVAFALAARALRARFGR